MSFKEVASVSFSDEEEFGEEFTSSMDSDSEEATLEITELEEDSDSIFPPPSSCCSSMIPPLFCSLKEEKPIFQFIRQILP